MSNGGGTDVIELLARANPVDTETLARADESPEAEETLTRILATPRRAAPSAHRRWLVALAAVAVLGLAGALIPGALLPDERLGASQAAARELTRAAAVAERQAPVVPAPGSFAYTKSRSFGLLELVTDAAGRPSFSALIPRTREIWIGADGSGRLRETSADPIFLGPGDRAAWEAAGSPPLRERPSDQRFGPGGLHLPDLAALPTDPDALYEHVLGQTEDTDVPTNVEMLILVGDLLRETAAPPELRAALYRVASRIEGIELIGRVTDRAGRAGIAVGITSDYTGAREQKLLIFDPHTSALLAERTVLLERVPWLDADPPVVIGDTLYLASGVVGSPDETVDDRDGQ
jgi:hypothetical protein